LALAVPLAPALVFVSLPFSLSSFAKGGGSAFASAFCCHPARDLLLPLPLPLPVLLVVIPEEPALKRSEGPLYLLLLLLPVGAQGL
jgi:hypothetical protein